MKAKSIDDLAAALPKSRKDNPVVFWGRIELHDYIPEEPSDPRSARYLQVHTYFGTDDRYLYMVYKGRIKAERIRGNMYRFRSGKIFDYFVEIEKAWEITPRIDTGHKKSLAACMKDKESMQGVPSQVHLYVG